MVDVVCGHCRRVAGTCRQIHCCCPLTCTRCYCCQLRCHWQTDNPTDQRRVCGTEAESLDGEDALASELAIDSANSDAVNRGVAVAVKSACVAAGVVSPLAAWRRHESPDGNAFWQQTLADQLIRNDQEMKGWQVDLPTHSLSAIIDTQICVFSALNRCNNIHVIYNIPSK